MPIEELTNPQVPGDSKLLTVTQVATYLECRRSTVQTLIRNGVLTPIARAPGQRKMFSKAQVDRVIKLR